MRRYLKVITFWDEHYYLIDNLNVDICKALMYDYYDIDIEVVLRKYISGAFYFWDDFCPQDFYEDTFINDILISFKIDYKMINFVDEKFLKNMLKKWTPVRPQYIKYVKDLRKNYKQYLKDAAIKEIIE